MALQPRVAAVVVTYNRKALLLECMQAILNQTRPVDDLIVIDNASTDGTADALREAGLLDRDVVHYVLMEKNTGGAGGFAEGMRQADGMSPDWIWIMDDDTIPEPDCLAALLAGAGGRKVSFMASCIRGMDGEAMNVPVLDGRPESNGYAGWYRELGAGLVKIRSATFVSLLFSGEAVRRCGFPCADYFIWGDDFEYTTRMTTHYGPAYLVGASWAVHKRVNARALDVRTEDDPNRIRNYVNYYRNNLINEYVYNGPRAWRIIAVSYLKTAVRCLRLPHGFRRFGTVVRGIMASRPMRKPIKRYVEEQLKGH